MARVNITLSDELVGQARAVGLNLSRCAAQGVAEELDGLTRRAALVEYLQEQDAVHGAPSGQALAAAEDWADRAGTVSAVDAVVAAFAGDAGYVLTSDPDDLSALCQDRPGVRVLGG